MELHEYNAVAPLTESLNLFCQCCLFKENLTLILKETNEMLNFCFAISLTTESENYICSVCAEKIRDSYQFKTQMLRIQSILNPLVPGASNNKATKQEIEDNDSHGQTFWGTESDTVGLSESDGKRQDREENTKSEVETEEFYIKQLEKKLKNNIKLPRAKKRNPLQKKEPNQGRNLPYQIDKKSLTCHICNTKFIQFRALQNHMPTHFPDFICHICGRLFPNEFHLKIHQKCHQQRHLKCEHCDSVFKTKSTLQQHVNIIHLGRKKQFKCFSCEQSFPTYYLRVKHMIHAHGMEGKKFKCHLCPKQFHIANHLQEHIRKQHLNVRPFSCDKCPYKAHTSWALKQHYVTHTGEKRFRCNVCYKSYGRRNTLQEHQKVHKVESKPICDKHLRSCDAAGVAIVSDN